MRIVWKIVLSFSLLWFSAAHATVPPKIAFQGFATDKTSGQPLDGTFDITFNLYNVDIGGSALWSETWNGANQVTISDGVFNVPLGQLSAFGATLFSEPLFLGITIGADAEMAPRQPVLSVPYALIANGVTDGAIDSSMLGTDAVETDNIVDGSVTAAKIDSTGLNADAVDGIDGSNIITATGGGTISDADLEVAGSGKIIAGPMGMQFSDGTTQVTAAIQASGLGSVIPVTCDPSGATTPLQDAIDTLGPGGFVTIEIDGICKENVRATRNFLEIRGATGSSSDGIECEGNGPAFEVRDPVIAWLADLDVSCPGNTAVRVSRNGVIGMYGFQDKVTLTDSRIGAVAQYGGNFQMFGVESSGNTETALYLLDGSTAYLNDIQFQESIDPDTHTTGTIEIGRNSSARITGNNTVISNSFFDPGGGDPRVGWAIDVFFDSQLRLQDVDAAAGEPTVVGDILCSRSSNMELRSIDVTGSVFYFHCDGDLRDSAMQGSGAPAWDAALHVTGGSVNLRSNTLDVGEIRVDHGGELYLEGSNVVAGTPRIGVNNASGRFHADMTFDEFIANGPGSIEIVGTLSDDTDGNDDFHVNSMVDFYLGGEINGNVFVGKNSNAILWDGASVQGRVDIGDGTVLNISETAVVRDCLGVQDSSILRIEDGHVFGTSTSGHITCWPGGASIFVSDHAKAQIGSFGSGATVNGGIDVARNSILQVADGSTINGDAGIDRNSILEMSQNSSISNDVWVSRSSFVDLYGATISGHLSLDGSETRITSSDDSIDGDVFAQRSAIQISGNTTFDIPGNWNMVHGSQLQLDNDASVTLANTLFLDHHSRLTLRNGASIARAGSGDHAVHAENLSIIELQENSSVTGYLTLNDTSLLVTGGGVTFDGDVNIGQAPSRAHFNGAPDSFSGSSSIFCGNGGVVQGMEPTFDTGSIDAGCDDQTFVPLP